MDFDEEFAYTIVSSREVDPLNNMISDQSPIGRVLIGTKVGDVVSVEVPDGIAKFKVMKIEKKN
jgi:transcription elongation factor GreA